MRSVNWKKSSSNILLLESANSSTCFLKLPRDMLSCLPMRSPYLGLLNSPWLTKPAGRLSYALFTRLQKNIYKSHQQLTELPSAFNMTFSFISNKIGLCDLHMFDSHTSPAERVRCTCTFVSSANTTHPHFPSLALHPRYKTTHTFAYRTCSRKSPTHSALCCISSCPAT